MKNSLLTFLVLTLTCGVPAQLVQPNDFEYQGAFRLPDAGDRPATFEYGGMAMTFRPDGDPGGSGDGFPGSLFVMGHPRLAYGELPDGNQIAEVTIPKPSKGKNLEQMSQSAFVQSFHNAAQGLFKNYEEIPRVGMEYLNTPATGPLIHLAWGQHFHEDERERIPTHAWIDIDLSSPNPRGSWYIGNQSFYCVNGYLFEIPAAWAHEHVGGRLLATGRFRDGGWSGQGPALYAYRPWTDDRGTPAADGTRLDEVELLHYANSRETEDVVSNSLRGYQHPDEWHGGAWLTTSSGKTALLFAGTKGTGSKYWYGWINPSGADIPCVETAFVNDFPTCRQADGSPCPQSDLGGCEGHNDYRGWWSSRFNAQFILYNPDDIAKVAAGEAEPSSPQPYASLNLDEYLLLSTEHGEDGMLGVGPQRRYRISAVAYDRGNDLLYVLEPFAEYAKPLVHVWKIK